MKKIGLCITGSFCTFKTILEEIKKLAQNNDVYPVFSFNTASTDTRFFAAQDFCQEVAKATGRKPIVTIADAEPFGPANKMDIMIIAPCTGNTLAKLAAAVTDTPVLMAAKAHLRNNRPLLIALSTNDALAANAKNIGELLGRKNIYFVPFAQDNHTDKPHSLIARYNLIGESMEKALEGQQIQPVLWGE